MQERRRSRGAWPSALETLVACAILVVVATKFSLVELAPRDPAAPRSREPTAIATTPDDAHGQAFAIYDAFVGERDECALATIVAQLEGGVARRRTALEDAGLDEWTAQRETLREKYPGCDACVAGALQLRPTVRAAATAALAARGGAPKKAACSFDGGDWVPAARLDGAWARHKSTLVIECPVPPELRSKACAASGAAAGWNPIRWCSL